MDSVRIERNLVLHLDRVGPDLHHDAELGQRAHQRPIEVGDRAGAERDGPGTAVRDLDVEAVVDKIEIDLEDLATEGDGRGCESAGRHAERNLPPVVEKWDECKL